MTEPTVRELIAELHAADPFWILETAHELGRIGDPSAVQPLIDALPRTLAPEVTDFDIPCNNAVAVVDALAELGDAGAAPAIRAALIAGHAHELVGAACAALVRLHDTAAVPVLERLLLDYDKEYCANYLASALAALGGKAQGELLRRLLASGSPRVVKAAVDALGQMRHRPATPEVAALQAADDDDLATRAFQALVRMGSATPADVRRGLARASWFWKLPLVDLVVASGPDGAVDVVREYLAEVAPTEENDAIRAGMRVKQTQLGSVDAVADLRVIARDGTASSPARVRAVVGLLDLDDGEFLGLALEFLRVAALDRDAPRGAGAIERIDVHEGVVDAAVRFATRHDDAFLPVVDVLDVLRRSAAGPAQNRAWELVPELTGTITYAEFDAWRAARPAG